MIKFFRKIRQRLLSESKFSKYLIYAIGEIILVVIGILIALQINNWNEARKSRGQEIALLTQLQSEFESNQAQLEEKMAMRDGIIKSALTLLSYVDDPIDLDQDSVSKHIGQVKASPTFDPIVNDLISSGRIQLLQSEALKDRLSRWTSDVVQVTEEEQVMKKFQNTDYLQLAIEHYSFRNVLNDLWINSTTTAFQLDKDYISKLDLGYSKQKFDQMSLIANPQFEDHLSFIATVAQITNTQSVSLNNRISEILQLIEQELEGE